VLTLHVSGGERASIGILDPHPPSNRIRLYDFGDGYLKDVDASQIISVANAEPAGVSFAPNLFVVDASVPLAANRKVVRLTTRRKKAPIPENFVSGYDQYAGPRGRYWREHNPGPQPLLAAGVFSLSSIQTPIVTALKLFSMLTPHVLEDELPNVQALQRIVKRAGAGLDSTRTGRPRWYVEYERYRHALALGMEIGLRDDDLRYAASVDTSMPLGLGLAKLSFTLALVGNDLGCLDARIIKWAFSPSQAERFNSAANRKKKDGSVSERSYRAYRSAELRILAGNSPFYDPSDPVALARSQWMLWESLGPEADRTHSHEEIFEAVVDDRLDELG
jgi:hypothetical protein